jgi:lycopene cyclase domain-containing protein
MIGFVYLAALLVAVAGMIVLDRRFRLFFWRSAWRAGIVLAVGLAFFLVWDLQGIRLGIFFRGETSLMTGWQWAPQLPLEEPFFLLLLCYLAMNLYGFVSRFRSPLARPSDSSNRSEPASVGPTRPKAGPRSGERS